jgi:hypothetical protein
MSKTLKPLCHPIHQYLIYPKTLRKNIKNIRTNGEERFIGGSAKQMRIALLVDYKCAERARAIIKYFMVHEQLARLLGLNRFIILLVLWNTKIPPESKS